MNSFDPNDQLRVLDQWPQSVRWTLPRRQLGWVRQASIPLILAGLFIQAALVAAVEALVFRQGAPRIDICFLAPLAMLALPTRAGFVPIWWGLALLWGYRELELRDGYLRSTERVGPLWYGKRWKIADIQRLDIKDGSQTEHKPPKNPAVLSRCALLLHTHAHKTGVLAWGYPQGLLRPLAEQIAARAEQAIEFDPLHNGGEESESAPIAVTTSALSLEKLDLTGAGAANAPPPPRPESSTIEVERFDDGVTIRVPPLGLVKGSGGLFGFSILWNGFMSLFTAVFVFAALGDKANPQDNLWFAFLFIGLFWAIGVAMLLAAINMGRRHAALAVAGGSFMVLQKSMWGTKQREWPLEQVAAITAGPSGVEVNDRPLLELQVFDHDGQKFAVLNGRADDELLWLAGLLREVVGVPSQSSRGVAEGAAAVSNQPE